MTSAFTVCRHLGHYVVNARYLHVVVDGHIGPERRRWVTAVLHKTRLSAPASEGAAPVVPNPKSLIHRPWRFSFFSNRRFFGESRSQGQKRRQRLVAGRCSSWVAERPYRFAKRKRKEGMTSQSTGTEERTITSRSYMFRFIFYPSASRHMGCIS